MTQCPGNRIPVFFPPLSLSCLSCLANKPMVPSTHLYNKGHNNKGLVCLIVPVLYDTKEQGFTPQLYRYIL